MEPLLKQFLWEEINRLIDNNKPVPRSLKTLEHFEGIYDYAFPQLFEEILTEKLNRITTAQITEIRFGTDPFSCSVFYNFQGLSIVKNIAYRENHLKTLQEGFFYGIVVRGNGKVLFSQSLNLGESITWYLFFELIKL